MESLGTEEVLNYQLLPLSVAPLAGSIAGLCRRWLLMLI